MTNYAIANEVLAGKWGNGEDRKRRLTEAGYDYNAVQSIVNALVKDRNYKPTEDMATTQTEPGNPLEIDFNPNEHDGIIINIVL